MDGEVSTLPKEDNLLFLQTRNPQSVYPKSPFSFLLLLLFFKVVTETEPSLGGPQYLEQSCHLRDHLSISDALQKIQLYPCFKFINIRAHVRILVVLLPLGASVKKRNWEVKLFLIHTYWYNKKSGFVTYTYYIGTYFKKDKKWYCQQDKSERDWHPPPSLCLQSTCMYVPC